MLRSISPIIFCLALCLGIFTGRVQASEIHVIGLPQNLSHEQGQEVYRNLHALVHNQLPAGAQLHVVDATNVQTLARFQIPDGQNAKIPNIRKRHINEPWQNVQRFVKANWVNTPKTQTTGRIHLPQTLTHLSTQSFVDVSDRNICTLIIGDARYFDTRHEKYNMQGTRYPSDGFLTASQAESPYGTADKQGFLEGFNVHFATLNERSDFASDHHELRVHRLWHLHVQAQGGTLATYTSSMQEAFDRFINCDQKPGRTFAWDSTRRVRQMLSMEASPEMSTANSQPSGTVRPKPQKPVNRQSEPQLPATDNMDWLNEARVQTQSSSPSLKKAAFKIGIRWGDSGQCKDSDLDLWFRSSPDRPWLFYGNKTSDDGAYDKDFRAAPENRNGLEVVDVTDQVDLSKLQIRINHYSGTCPDGPKGKIRVFLNSAIYETDFHIKSRNGNRGRDRSQMSSEHWTAIDPNALFNFEG
jgi:hypothetical protein